MSVSAHPSDSDSTGTQLDSMSEKTAELLRLVRDAFVKRDRAPLGPAFRLGREVHQLETRLIASIAEPGAASGDQRDRIFLPMHLERMVDGAEALASATEQVIADGTLFTVKASNEITHLFGLAIDLAESVRDVLRTGNRALISHVLEEGRRIEEQAIECALSHQKRLIEGVCLPRASSLFVAMLDHLKGIEWHAREIAQKMAASHVSPDMPDRRQRAD